MPGTDGLGSGSGTRCMWPPALCAVFLSTAGDVCGSGLGVGTQDPYRPGARWLYERHVEVVTPGRAGRLEAGHRAWEEVQPGTPAGTDAGSACPAASPAEAPLVGPTCSPLCSQHRSLHLACGARVFISRNDEREVQEREEVGGCRKGDQSLVSTPRCVRFNSSSSASGDRPRSVWGQSASRAHTEAPAPCTAWELGVLGRMGLSPRL